ncbi:pentapeptide repeat-containing protein [Nocardia sp. NPDC059764]|uniref:pentapeptide repeat-containing protein n=1 Tax=Nocardia sp. NPDC059764 TaxID=3346939 RepID=UPI003667B42E
MWGSDQQIVRVSGVYALERIARDSAADSHTVVDVLDGTNLLGARVDFANLEGADLSSANLEFANLSHSRLDGVNLSALDGRGADLAHADLHTTS